MRKIDDYITFIHRKEDRPYLRNKLLDVNMRLFQSSEGYRKIVMDCCQYLEQLMLQKYSDYPMLRGISGANAGIPFNIIGFIISGTETLTTSWVKIMINPHIIKVSEETRIARSNCGSIRLEEPIKVIRNKKILVNWTNTSSVRVGQWFKDREAFTIQHEIEHNQGILITDKEVVE